MEIVGELTRLRNLRLTCPACGRRLTAKAAGLLGAREGLPPRALEAMERAVEESGRARAAAPPNRGPRASLRRAPVGPALRSRPLIGPALFPGEPYGPADPRLSTPRPDRPLCGGQAGETPPYCSFSTGAETRNGMRHLTS